MKYYVIIGVKAIASIKACNRQQAISTFHEDYPSEKVLYVMQ